MNFAGTALPSMADIDATLRETDELRAMLNGLVTGSCNMLATLGRRESALKDCRAALASHFAEIAVRAATAPVATPPNEPVTSASAVTAAVPLTPEARLLTFAAIPRLEKAK